MKPRMVGIVMAFLILVAMVAFGRPDTGEKVDTADLNARLRERGEVREKPSGVRATSTQLPASSRSQVV